MSRKRPFKKTDLDQPDEFDVQGKRQSIIDTNIFSKTSIDVENQTQTDAVELIVEDLVTELVNTTGDSELDESLRDDKSSSLIDHSLTISSQHPSTSDALTEINSTTTQLDDSFKLSYDFNLLPNDALYSDAQFETSFNDATSSLAFNSTGGEHNYANVPSTSNYTADQSSSLLHSTAPCSSMSVVVRPTKGVLRIKNHGDNDRIKTDSTNSLTTTKKNVKFKEVQVFYFPRNQGGSAVPSQGGSTLGMEMSHCDLKNFTLDAHQEEKRKVHREILLRQKRYERLYQKQLARICSLNQSDSDEDSLENISDMSDSELDFDSWYFLQPVPVKQRRALLRESGVNKIDSSEKEECKYIRVSREYCGCECRVFCDPETCQCSLNNIKCQVDRQSFPCGCSRDSCNNLNGRTEFNPIRVRTHFIHTLMRLELEKKNESQQFTDELSTESSMNSLKQQSSVNNENNTVPSNQRTLFTPSSSSTTSSLEVQQSDQISPQPYYELKFTPLSSMSSSITNNDFTYNTTNQSTTLENPNNSNILSEVVNSLPLGNDDLYDSGDTGSSSYSENSQCTSEDLDAVTNNTHSLANNVTKPSNELTFNNISSFPIVSIVPTTNESQINATANVSTTLAYDQTAYHTASVSSTSNASYLNDQSFRYYPSTSSNNSQTQPNLMAIPQVNANLNHNPYYYADASSLYNNHPLIDCYTSHIPNQPSDHQLLPKPMLNNSDLQRTTQIANHYENNFQQSSLSLEQSSSFIETQHYFDLSQSIATSKSSVELFASNNTSSNNHFDSNVNCSNGISLPDKTIVDDSRVTSTIVNSPSDDSSNSGQSSNANLDDNLTSSESTANDEENNFGEIIKSTIVESVTA